MVKLNKEHVIVACPAVSYDRDALGIGAYFHANSADFSRKFKDYFGGDNAPTMTIHRRAGLINTLIFKWFRRVGPTN